MHVGSVYEWTCVCVSECLNDCVMIFLPNHTHTQTRSARTASAARPSSHRSNADTTVAAAVTLCVGRYAMVCVCVRLCVCEHANHHTISPVTIYSTSQTARYTTQRYAVPHYITLHYITLHYTTSHYTTSHCTTPQHTTLHHTALHHNTVLRRRPSRLPCHHGPHDGGGRGPKDSHHSGAYTYLCL
jgi:hypothetical protein